MCLQFSNVLSNSTTNPPKEPFLVDNYDGNWTAIWEFENPNNYSLMNVDLIDGKALLKSHKHTIVENKISQFKNGTWNNIMAIGNFGIGLDLKKNYSVLIADANNNRVLEIDFKNWVWQYGSNTTSGYGLNQLDEPSFAVRVERDKTLITDTENNRVIKVGPKAEFYWQYGSNITPGKGDNRLNRPRSALPMQNGNILIADTDNDVVLEVNKNKKWVWQFGYKSDNPLDWGSGDSELNRPTHAEELMNGSILITDKYNHRIIEVNRLKQIYWQYGWTGIPGASSGRLDSPSYAMRLENGNTLIADTNNHRIIEVDFFGNIIWKYGRDKIPGSGLDRLSSPTCAVRLPNGHTLITDTVNHRVLEVNRTKSYIWQYGTNGTSGCSINQLNIPLSGIPFKKDFLQGVFISQVLDGGEVTKWTNISWEHITPPNSAIILFTRTGDTPSDGTGSWSPWSSSYNRSIGQNITSPMNRCIQYAVVFFTFDLNVTPILKSVTINGTRYDQYGELITNYLKPRGLLKWNKLYGDAKLNGQNIDPYFSIASWDPWTPVENGNLENVPIETGRIRFKLIFTTDNISITPILYNLSVIFECLGLLSEIKVTPNDAKVIAGTEFEFKALGFDPYGHEIIIDPTWSSTLGEMEGSRLITQTKVGTGYVNASIDNIVGSAEVTVIPGPLNYIIVKPSEVEVVAGESYSFEAFGYDEFDNEVLIEPIWKTDVGTMNEQLFVAQKFAGQGTVKAMVDDIAGSANVTVILNSSQHHPPKIKPRVPDQVRPEDSEPWMLNLANHEIDDEDFGEDLRWYITNVDQNLYTVTGAFSKEDILTFIPKPNAFGNNKAKLWLVDSDNMTTSQALWVNITPINDKPLIKEVPDIIVHYNEPYTFDYTNYISDIETLDVDLILSVIEPAGNKYTSISGLNVTYNYPENMLGKNVILTLVVSDGEAESKETVQVSITDNHAPILIKPFPEITLTEGETKRDVFDLDDHFMDPDGDLLNYFFSVQYLSVSISVDNSITISSTSSWSGSESITFRAMDTFSAMAEGYAKVIVRGVNDPPQISPIPDIYVHYDYEYQFNLSKYIFDPDNETSELSIWTTDPGNISFHSSYNSLMLLSYPEILLGQKIGIQLFVSDGIDITSTLFWVHITDNFPPVIRKEFTDIHFQEDSEILNAFNLEEHFIDWDDSKLTFSFELTDKQNISITINENSSVDFSSEPNWFGTSSVTFKAMDSEDAFIESGIEIVVIPVNDPPVIGLIPTQHGKVGERWVLDLTQYLSDVDNDLTEIEIVIDDEYANIVAIAGKQLTFHAFKPIDIELEIIASDGITNSTSAIELIVTEDSSEDVMVWLWTLIMVIVLIILISLITVVRRQYGNFTITDVFLIHKSGILIRYKGSTLKENSDQDIISGMLTAVQSFITDSFADGAKKEKDDWKLNQLRLGGHEIMIECGKYVFLTVIYTGTPGRRLQKLLLHTIAKIENKYGTVLNNWCGRFDLLEGIEDLIIPLLTIEEKPIKELNTNYDELKPKEPVIEPILEVIHPSPSIQILPQKSPAQITKLPGQLPNQQTPQLPAYKPTEELHQQKPKQITEQQAKEIEVHLPGQVPGKVPGQLPGQVPQSK